MSIVTSISVAALALTFGWAGGAKVLRSERWRQDLTAYGLGRPIRATAFLTLPWIELLVAAALVGGESRVGAAVALVLVGAFCLAIVRARTRQGSDKLGCGCFGASAPRDYRLLLLRNAGVGALAAYVFASSAGPAPAGISFDRVAVLPVVIGGLAALAGLWMMWQVTAYLRRRTRPSTEP